MGCPDAWPLCYAPPIDQIFGGWVMGEQEDRRGQEQSLSELVEELESLKVQVNGLSANVLEKLEEGWSLFHSVLFPQIRQWMERLQVKRLIVYRLQADSMRHEPHLSVCDSDALPQMLQVSQDAAIFASLVGPSAPTLLAHCLVARELRVDFEECTAVFPFCLFDRVVGVFFASFDALEENQYPQLCAATERMLDRLRREILVGRLAELRKTHAS
jgi:hypothetical protein